MRGVPASARRELSRQSAPTTPSEVYTKWDVCLSDQPVGVGSRTCMTMRVRGFIDPSRRITPYELAVLRVRLLMAVPLTTASA